MTEHILVFSNFPDNATAQSAAQALVEARLAACVNVLAPCRSVYRWKGEVEAADEIPVMIKTTKANYSRLEQAIRERHPYELPEIIAVPIIEGLPAYLAWVGEEVTTNI